MALRACKKSAWRIAKNAKHFLNIFVILYIITAIGPHNFYLAILAIKRLCAGGIGRAGSLSYYSEHPVDWYLSE